MVLPRNTLLEFTDLKVSQLQSKLNSDKKIGIIEAESKKRQTEIDDLISSKEILVDLPAYEDEVTLELVKFILRLSASGRGLFYLISYTRRIEPVE